MSTFYLIVSGESGQNSLEFLDIGGGSVMVDNVAVYAYKTNKFCMNRVYAVLSGYPVTPISVVNEHHENWQLDAGAPPEGYAWLPISHTSSGQWIQVSSLTPKLWESVIVQGRGDSPAWVTKFRIQYTIDGRTWTDYENGK